MAKTYGPDVYDMAKSRMNDNRAKFPEKDFDALVIMLAKDIQGVLDDFTNDDYVDITITHLRRQQARETEEGWNALYAPERMKAR